MKGGYLTKILRRSIERLRGWGRYESMRAEKGGLKRGEDSGGEGGRDSTSRRTAKQGKVATSVPAYGGTNASTGTSVRTRKDREG